MTRPAALSDDNAGLNSFRVRERMVERIRQLGVSEPRVLAAMLAVPRHLFVDPALASRAYDDCALPIGFGQTISQPYIVARSAELALQSMAEPRLARILEIGTGCGYASAVYAGIFGQVYTVERIRALHDRARSNLRPFRLAHVRLVFGDGMQGLPADAPYDAIIAAAAGSSLPAPWVEQLSPQGIVVAPVGEEEQQLSVFRRNSSNRWVRQDIEPVRFVPLRSGISAA